MKKKITLSGSLGRIGKPLTRKLVALGHSVTVISSNSNRANDIKSLGAIPAIGQIRDTDFLKSTFKGADAVYTMVPPANYFDHQLDLLGYFKNLGNSFAKALENTTVDHVVNLSSIGAHLNEGNGILKGTYHVERALDGLPNHIGITHVRPVEIYYNLYQFIPLIKHQGIIGSNLAADNVNVWVSPEDIATSVVEELEAHPGGRKVRYVASEELTYQEVASILGSAIGKPDLKWVMLTDEQLQGSLENIGMQPKIAAEMTEMYAAIRNGLLYEDYKVNRPKTLGKVKLREFAKDFARAYENS